MTPLRPSALVWTRDRMNHPLLLHLQAQPIEVTDNLVKLSGLSLIPWFPGITFHPCRRETVVRGATVQDSRMFYDEQGRLARVTIDEEVRIEGPPNPHMSPGGVVRHLDGHIDRDLEFRWVDDRLEHAGRLDHRWDNGQLVDLVLYQSHYVVHRDKAGRVVELEQQYHLQPQTVTTGSRVSTIGRSTFRYDKKGRLVERTVKSNGRRPVRTRYRYDKKGRLSRIDVEQRPNSAGRFPSPIKLRYEDDRLVAFGDVTIAYDHGRVYRMTFPGGLETFFEYQCSDGGGAAPAPRAPGSSGGRRRPRR